MKNKQLMINIIAGLIAFGVQMVINFFLTPVLVTKLGNEAYGFIGLANNFVSYATIITIALNSMASRYIAIEIHRGNQKKANGYYSSVFLADTILAAVVLVLTIGIIVKLNAIITIPEYLDIDVKITFLCVFINFILSLIGTVFNVATFVKNRLDITSMIQIIGNILKLIVLIVLFVIFKPKIYYISIAAIVYTVWVFFSNARISKKIAPELVISKKLYKFQYIKELISSGIWNSINSLSRVLLTGLDLLMANIFIGANEMGILSIAKTIPNAVENLFAVIGNVFAPQFTILYSKNKIEDLVKETNFSIKLLSLMMTVPLAGFIVFGKEFYSLWLSNKSDVEIMQIQILSILTLAPYMLSAFIYTLSYLDTVTNQLKRPVIFTFIISILSVITAIILIKFINLGIYAIAGASSIYWCLKMLFFTPINAAYNLKIKLTTFYKPFIRAIVCLLIIVMLFVATNMIVVINSWMDFCLLIFVVGILGYIINFILLLNKKEKKIIIESISKKYKESKIHIKKKYIKIILIGMIIILISNLGINIILGKIKENKYLKLKNSETTTPTKYIHFSVDDTINIFKDLTKNQNKYNTMFKNNTLKYLKKMHDIYGVKVTLYCFFQDITDGFTLEKCTDKFKNEFQQNSNWLKLGFHTKNANINYKDFDDENIYDDYKKMMEEFYRITGEKNCIDSCIRLQNYAGTYDNIKKIIDKNIENGVQILLSADDDRENYYLSEEQNFILNRNEYYIDDYMGISFIKTDIRLENINDVNEEFKKNNGEEQIIVFSHENLMNKNSIRKKLEKILQLGIENNYGFDFPKI